MILTVVSYGCENWSLTLREEHSFRLFENRVLRTFGHKREEDGQQETGENLLMRRFIIYLHQILLG
jgi:hypothetical protein